jgi:3-oxoacyl-[acyl-carrier-protein] synthase-3
MRAQIIATGSYLPKQIIHNDDLSQTMETSDEWIASRTGIRQRHRMRLENNESCAKMGYYAALKALEMAHISANDIDLIIVATISPDYRLPSTACLIQEMLGLTSTPAFDIMAACAGSIYGLSIANSFIKSGAYKKILFISPEAMSSLINWEDRNTAILFGDGASAAIIAAAADKDSGFLAIDLYADGRQQKTISIEAGGSSHPIDEEALREKHDKIVMNGRETYKFAVRVIFESIEKLLEEHNVSKDKISFVVPHQANIRIIEAIAERSGIPMERFLVNLDRVANTSAASLLLAYDEALRAQRIKKNDLILMLAIGSGFVWGAGLYRA